jgi:ferritin-like metal-binding protein YciE
MFIFGICVLKIRQLKHDREITSSNTQELNIASKEAFLKIEVSENKVRSLQREVDKYTSLLAAAKREGSDAVTKVVLLKEELENEKEIGKKLLGMNGLVD